MEWVTVGTFVIGALLRAPDLIQRVREVGRSRQELEELNDRGRSCLRHLGEVRAEINRLSKPEPTGGFRRRSEDQETLSQLCNETKELIDYCKKTVEKLMGYEEKYKNHFHVKLLHWLAGVKHNRVEVYDGRLRECVLWMKIASLTTFLHANYDVALDISRRPHDYHVLRGHRHGHGSDFLKLCQDRAGQLSQAIADVTNPKGHPEKMERHMKQFVDLTIFRSNWKICYERFLELPRSPLSSMPGSTVGPGTRYHSQSRDNRDSRPASSQYYDAPAPGNRGMASPYEEQQHLYPHPPGPELRRQPEPTPFIVPVSPSPSRQDPRRPPIVPTQHMPDYDSADEARYRAEQPRRDQVRGRSFSPQRPRAPSPDQRPARSWTPTRARPNVDRGNYDHDNYDYDNDDYDNDDHGHHDHASYDHDNYDHRPRGRHGNTPTHYTPTQSPPDSYNDDNTHREYSQPQTNNDHHHHQQQQQSQQKRPRRASSSSSSTTTTTTTTTSRRSSFSNASIFDYRVVIPSSPASITSTITIHTHNGTHHDDDCDFCPPPPIHRGGSGNNRQHRTPTDRQFPPNSHHTRPKNEPKKRRNHHQTSRSSSASSYTTRAQPRRPSHGR